MAGKKSDLGPSGITLAANVKRLRGNLGYAELSRRLSELGRDIPSLGLRRIEAGQRRVDADDLIALSAALGVSPVTLLMPYSTDADYTIAEATGLDEPCGWEQWWEWLTAQAPHPYMRDRLSLLGFGGIAWPHPLAMRESRRLNAKFLDPLLNPQGDADGDDQ